MRILANENIPAAVIDALSKRGHDVKWVRIVAPGATDRTVLEVAREEKRLLITFDKDFGELAFREGLPLSCGIILLRIPAVSPEFLAERVLKSLESRIDWTGYFSVIAPDRIRMTAMKPGT